MPRVYTDGAYRGQPPLGQANNITGMDPGDILVAKILGEWKVFLAHTTGLPDGSVNLVDVSQFWDNDVSITNPTDGQVLTYDAASGMWQNKAATGGSGSSTLAADTDVAISSPANNDVLTYDTASSKWKNKPASGGSAPDFFKM